MSDTEQPAGYAEAVTELESILSEIERADVDVDVLATKVRRANLLIEFCRVRISAAQDAVDDVEPPVKSDSPISAGSASEEPEPAGPDTAP